MNSYVFVWIPEDSFGFLCIPADSIGILWITMYAYIFLYGFLSIPKEFVWIPIYIYIYIYVSLWIHMNFYRFLCIPMDAFRFPTGLIWIRIFPIHPYRFL